MKKIKICATVSGHTLDIFLENISKTESVASCLELRVDTIQNLSVENIETIQKACKSETVFSCRNKDQGGSFSGSEQERLIIIETAHNLSFDHIEIDLQTLESNDLKLSGDPKKIISYYNFTETPKYWKLHPIMNKMYKYEPDVVKIATKVKTDNDVHTLFRLIVDKDNDDQWIIVGMGEEGKITRVLSPILGSYLTYAATPFSETADGQIQLEELKKIYDDLHVGY